MNYIPVRSFDFENPVVTVAGVVLLFALGLLVLFLWLFARADGRKRERTTVIFSRLATGSGAVAALALVVASAVMGYDFLGFNRFSERSHAVQAQIEKDYDLKLSRMEFHDLSYPDFRPQEDFAVYGSIQKNLPLAQGAYRSAKLSLVWSEGKFYLSESTNGEDFTPLKPKG